MGATFETLTYPGKLTQAEVRKLFDAAQDQDRYENGHSYSGGIGMATGLIFEEQVFDTAEAAFEFLHEACTKWEEARAVKYKEPDGTQTYLIGAMCAS
jgi:hypothetical protein